MPKSGIYGVYGGHRGGRALGLVQITNALFKSAKEEKGFLGVTTHARKTKKLRYSYELKGSKPEAAYRST